MMISLRFLGRTRFPAGLALGLAAWLAACGGGGETTTLATPAACNPLGGVNCMTPWPSSLHAVEDASTATGWRLDIPEGAWPSNIHMSVADEEVPNLATEWQARTMGIPVLVPAPFETPCLCAEGVCQ